MLLNDNEIKVFSLKKDKPLISPFLDKKISSPSYGLSSFGYDVRLGPIFVEFIPGVLIDPKHFDKRISINKYNVFSYVLKPHGFILAHTVEKLCIPNNITGIVCDKSSYARCGIALQNTVLEAGWYGTITLEITNHSENSVILYVNRGIAQILFFKGNECSHPYGDGKYQGQIGVQLPK